MPDIELKVPLRVVSKDNTRMVNHHTGRVFTNTSRLKTFNAAFAALVRARLPVGFKMLEGPLYAEFIFHYSSKRHPDLLNCPKSVADILQGILYKDDRQIVESSLRICYCDDDGVTIRVRTTELTEDDCLDPTGKTRRTK